MTAPTRLRLEPGRAYRTRDLAIWSPHPSRLARQLVRNGALVRLSRGLFFHPKRSRFDDVPPTDDELMRVFLGSAPFVFTGPERWNALGLGTTAVHATSLVYNTKRSGMFELGGRRFVLRRVAFPESPPAEWFAVDLLEHADEAGASRRELGAALRRVVANGSPDRARVQEMAARYASKETRTLVESALASTT